ncbi:MAG: TIGR01777 family protein [Halioglobus sp.]|nr:TIGR01777 family protein [Halioglobus sp.]
MHIVVTGGTGFIGTPLCAALRASGHRVTVLSRRSRQDAATVGSLDEIDSATRVDALINLAGAPLNGRRWSAAYKQEIIDSRLRTTRAVLDLVERLDAPPAALLSASAVGYYGHHGDEILDEQGATEPGFAQDLCARWEELAGRAAARGVRVCLLRLGVVLDAGGGALQEMANSFRFGVGSWIGSGEQWLSWIHRDDVVRAVAFLLQRDELQGPFNLTAPAPVTSQQLCAALAQHHRVLLRAGVPGPVLRLLLGEVAQELLLNGQRVVPAALQAAGFRFDYPDVERALAAIYADQAS